VRSFAPTESTQDQDAAAANGSMGSEELISEWTRSAGAAPIIDIEDNSDT
jgi:hypothetical protein